MSDILSQNEIDDLLIIAELSVRDNIILALQVMKGFFKPFSRKQAEAFSNQFIQRRLAAEGAFDGREGE